jgi:hypothetical protein
MGAAVPRLGAAVLHLMYRWDQRGINSPTVTDLYTVLPIAPNSPLKRISTSHHQILREKAANFDWRADLLFPPLKRAFGSRLAGGSRVCYSWSSLLAG